MMWGVHSPRIKSLKGKKMSKIKWVKASGLKIETVDNEKTVEYCKSLGWKLDNGKKPGRPKADSSATNAENNNGKDK